MKYKITAEAEYVIGHIRCGHYELNLNEEEYQEYKSLSYDDQYEFLRERGDFVIDDYEIDDIGSSENIKIEEITEE